MKSMHSDPRPNGRSKLCYVVSSPRTAISFLNGHIDYLSDRLEISVVCNFDGTESKISAHAHLKNIRLKRSISPFADLFAVMKLTRFLRKGRFEIVHSVSPKAGLIAAISGCLARTPIRVHWYTGQVWANHRGYQRALLKIADRVIGILSTMTLVDSFGQRDFLVDERILDGTKCKVLGHGSIAGVDVCRFRSNPELRLELRNELNIQPVDSIVIIFLGRLTADKGIDQLLRIFSSGNLATDPYLLLVGQDENGFVPRLRTMLGSSIKRIRYVPHTEHPEKYLAAADIFCLPSLREGFGLSVIEAGACGLPAVISDIYGLRDSIIDGKTGYFFSTLNDSELTGKLNLLISNEELRRHMGAMAEQIVSQRFSAISLQQELRSFYFGLKKQY